MTQQQDWSGGPLIAEEEIKSPRPTPKKPKRSLGWYFWSIIGCISLALTLFTYGVLPLLVYLLSGDARVTLQEREPSDPNPPYDAASWIDRVSTDLEEMGFVARGEFLNRSGKLINHIFLFHHADNGDGVAVYVLDDPNRDDPLSRMNHYVEFLSNYDDELGKLELNTNNAKTPMMVDDYPGVYRFSFVELQDPTELYKLHRVMRDHFANGRESLETEIPDMLVWFEEGMERSNQRVVERGHMRPSHSDPKGFKLTLKGAYITTWKLLWPVNLLFRTSEDLREQVINDVGFTIKNGQVDFQKNMEENAPETEMETE